MGWPIVKITGPQFGKPAYISEVNEARKVKSDAQVARNKNWDPVQKLFTLEVAGEDGAPTPIFLNFRNCPKWVKLVSSYSGCRLGYTMPTVGDITVSRYPVDGT